MTHTTRLRPARVEVTSAEFRELLSALSSWGRWGDDDERGTLNLLGAEHVRAAARLVREGVSVSLSLPLRTQATADNPDPPVHFMTTERDGDVEPGALRFAKDFVGADYHHDGHTHIDAFRHVEYDGSLYNGVAPSAASADGANRHSIDALENGLVGRGVLLDIPRLRGVQWVEPGDHIFGDELEAAEREQRLSVASGDILLVRTGHNRRLAELGPWSTAELKAGLHPTAMHFVAERGVSALGSDGNSDTAPSSTEGVGFPIHVLALNAIGLHLLDYLRLEELSAACGRIERWTFLFVAAPLRIPGGTGSPLNPLAIL